MRWALRFSDATISALNSAFSSTNRRSQLASDSAMRWALRFSDATISALSSAFSSVKRWSQLALASAKRWSHLALASANSARISANRLSFLASDWMTASRTSPIRSVRRIAVCVTYSFVARDGYAPSRRLMRSLIG